MIPTAITSIMRLTKFWLLGNIQVALWVPWKGYTFR